MKPWFQALKNWEIPAWIGLGGILGWLALIAKGLLS